MEMKMDELLETAQQIVLYPDQYSGNTSTLKRLAEGFVELSDRLAGAGKGMPEEPKRVTALLAAIEHPTDGTMLAYITALRTHALSLAAQLAEVKGDAENCYEWSHFCDGIPQNITLWLARCPHCGKPRAALAAQLAAGEEPK